MNVLIVDDSRSVRFFLSKFLHAKNYSPIEASSGEQALELFTKNKIDLVIMDIEMPGIDGYETTRRIRNIAGNKWLPILFLTGKKGDDFYQQGFEAGGDAFLNKPFQSTQLEMQIHAMNRLVEMRDQILFREQRLQSILETAAEGIITVDDNNLISSCNLAVKNMFLYKPEELIAQSYAKLIVVEKEESIETYDIAALSNKYTETKETTERLELIGKRSDNSQFPIEVAITSLQLNSETFYTVIIRDISYRKAYENKILHQANYDELTNLPNRIMFHDQLKINIHRAKRQKNKVAVMFIDLDRFKQINDTLGHTAGDILLMETAKRLKNCVRDVDIVARLGGDEFTIILPDLKDEWGAWGPEKVASRILESISQPYFLSKNSESHVTGSVGIAIYPDDGDNEELLLRNADTAMYRAKSSGKNAYSFYTSAMTIEAEQHAKLEHHLRDALKDDCFTMVYQPQVCSKTGLLLSVEALLRWLHPEDGLVTPDKFIPLAEEIHLISDIGDWVLNEACAQLADWQLQGMPRIQMSVNVSVDQLNNDKFAQRVQEIIEYHQIEPKYLELEITESGVMNDPKHSMKVLNDLRQLGINLAIDDFGTGYSSMSYLKRLPINKLKIDRTFIKDIETDPNDVAIVRAVIALAKSLKLRVNAEGVETIEQKEFLIKEECDELQGFLFGKPLSPTDLTRYLKEPLDLNQDSLFCQQCYSSGQTLRPRCESDKINWHINNEA